MDLWLVLTDQARAGVENWAEKARPFVDGMVERARPIIERVRPIAEDVIEKGGSLVEELQSEFSEVSAADVLEILLAWRSSSD